VAVYDTGEDMTSGVPVPYIVMEYVDGRSAGPAAGGTGCRNGRWRSSTGWRAGLQPSRQIVHHDIRPGNMFSDCRQHHQDRPGDE
jgi:serine/threonine-protein kinase